MNAISILAMEPINKSNVALPRSAGLGNTLTLRSGGGGWTKCIVLLPNSNG
jgi:hypothetical protein